MEAREKWNCGERGRLSALTLILIAVVSALIPIALIGWKEVYASLLEKSAPQISFDEIPRGIGIAPVRLVIRAVDQSAGLDEIVVRAKQRGTVQEIERRDLEGLKEAVLNLEFPGKESGFLEGEVEFEVRVFDRSFWSNRGQKNLTLKVDYRSPALEVLTQQHNARQGGSQLLLYRAVDENLSVSGVRVGTKVFEGYPARLLDPDFTESNVYAAIYALPIPEPGSQPVEPKVFAEDIVGNPRSEKFYNRVKSRTLRKRKVKLTESFLRGTVGPLAELRLPELKEELSEPNKPFAFKTVNGSSDRLLEEFQILNTHLREADRVRMKPHFRNSRFQRYWKQAFLSQPGTVRYGFGEQLVYFSNDRPIADHVQMGYVYQSRSGGADVLAANGGVVLFVERLGALGLTIGIDHGLGLATAYANLSKSFVAQGDEIRIGDRVGAMGRSGLIASEGTSFFVFVQGVPVEPAEWLSKSWFRDHMTNKIREVKKILGIQVLDPF